MVGTNFMIKEKKGLVEIAPGFLRKCSKSG